MQDDFEKRTGLTFHSNRSRDRAAHRKLVAELLVLLEKCEDGSEPAAGHSAAPGKDRLAMQALGAAGELVRAVAGWAIDHQVGLAFADLGSLSSGAQSYRELPQFAEARAAVDDHRHEVAGNSATVDELSDPHVIRRSAINLLQMNAGGWPAVVSDELRAALVSLDFNEVSPIVAPAGSGKKANRTELLLQLEALAFVEFRAASHVATRYQACETISAALAVSPETLRSTWPKRVREALGTLLVAHRLAYAKNAAHPAAQERKNLLGKAVAMIDGHNEFGAAALARLVQRYNAARVAE